MKEGSDNFRSSAIHDIIKIIKSQKVKVIVYEPLLSRDNSYSYNKIESLESFKLSSNIIVANRMSNELMDVESKVFTRDFFGNG